MQFEVMIRAVAVAVVACAVACSDAPVTPTSPGPTSAPPAAQGCGRTSVGLTPIGETAGAGYLDQPLGLYPGRSNTMPASHLAAGLAMATSIGPLDADGRPDAAGRYGFISIGMSNTTQEFQAFMQMAAADASRNARLVIVDGAQGGQTAADWASPSCQCWSVLEGRLRQASLTSQQVAAAWIKLANRQPSGTWPTATVQLKSDIVTVIRALGVRFPNLRVAYLSSRIYAGYATTTLNPEPYAYESGFAVRWAIEDQLNGALPYDGPSRVSPWLAWGPYLWADGLAPRADGLTWSCSDLAEDGTHPSASGRQKVGQRLLDFLRTDPTAREWFVRP